MGFFDGISGQKEFNGFGGEDDKERFERTNDGGDFMAVPREPYNETTPDEAEIIARINEIKDIDSELEQIRLTPFLSKEDEQRRSQLEKRKELLFSQNT